MRAKRATLTFRMDKIKLKMPKMVHFGEFLPFGKPEACGQTVLPDRSVLIVQKLVENAKIQMGYSEYFSKTYFKYSESEA